MIRGLNLVLLVICVVALVGVYALKYRVEGTATEKAALEARIEEQQGELSLLKADWAYLNQPSHIEPIVTRHAEILNLQIIDQKQYGSFDDLPMRPATAPDTEAMDALFKALDAGEDPIAALIEAL